MITRNSICWFCFVVIGSFAFCTTELAAAVTASPPRTEITLQRQRGDPSLRVPSRYQAVLNLSSVWQAEVQLHGRQWLVGALERKDAKVSSLDARIWFFFVQPISATPASPAGAAWVFPRCPHLFFDQHAYEFNWRVDPNGSTGRPKLTFTPETPRLGELKVSGDNVRELQLHGRFVALLNPEERTIRLPVDNYTVSEITIGQTNNPFRWRLSQSQPVRITTNEPFVLNVGSTLTNAVSVTLRGRSLLLDYRLLGTDGRTYLSTDQSQPPRFKIYCEGKEVASGAFEYG